MMDPNNNQPAASPPNTNPTQNPPTPPPQPAAGPIPAPPPQPTVLPPTIQPSPAPISSDKSNTLAIVAVILAIFFPLAGLICGILALKNIKKTGDKGRGMALTAIIVAAVLLAFQVLFLIYVISIGASHTANTSSSTPSSSSSTPSDSSSQSSSSSSTAANPDDVLKNSQADATLQQDLIKAIAIKEKIAGRNGALEISSITKQPKQGSVFVEDWTVNVDGVSTTYRVNLTPTADGGADYTVQNLK